MKYISKIWLMTILVTPFIYWPVNIFVNDNVLFKLDEIGPVAIATMLGGCILSLPTFLILYFYLEKMKKRLGEERLIKNYFFLIGSIGVIGTFALLDFSILLSLIGILFPASYILVICFSTYFFKIDQNSEHTNYG